MFLLNNDRIAAYMRTKDLSIEGFNKKLLHSTFYYFRLGRAAVVFDPGTGARKDQLLDAKGEAVVIPPNGYARVSSLELFSTSERVLGIFGHPTDLIKRDLALVHSPSIDPHFHGYLEMGLKNNVAREQTIRYGDLLGKVIFFDISDSYPIPTFDDPQLRAKLLRRETLDAVMDQLIDPTSEW